MATEHNTIFKLAADYVQFTNESIFLTGKAGTGKTTFLRYIREHSGKQTAVIAPTGVAAINAGGTTIHSFFQLPFTPFIPGPIRTEFDMRKVQEQDDKMVDKHHLLGRLKLNREKIALIREVELLIIDEVSMVRCDTLDAIDTVMRHYRYRYHEPFGGAQLLFIGDMHQLPPVIPNEEWEILSQFYSSPYFFSSKVAEQQPPIFIELEKIYRQSDPTFIDVLNKVRNHKMDNAAMDVLKSRYNPSFSTKENDGYITLTTHNSKAFTMNQTGLANLTTEPKMYKAIVEGEFSDKAYPAEENLQLKVGAQVMFIKNDKEKVRRYYNGKIGVVSKMDELAVYVSCKGESDIPVMQEKWENIKYTFNQTTQKIEEAVIGSFQQFPLRLAWAITIHKSQGLTFEKAVVDAGSAFAPGQVYVALSRCTSLEGLVLQSLITSQSLITDERILEFDLAKSNAQALENNLFFCKQMFQEKTIVELFNFDKEAGICDSLVQLLTDNKANFNEEGLEWVTQIFDRVKGLQQVATKFQAQLNQLFGRNDYSASTDRIIKATAYFTEQLGKLVVEIPKSPTQTDSRTFTKEYNDDLKILYGGLYRKNELIGTCKNGFDTHAYQQQKSLMNVPHLGVNAFVGSQLNKKSTSAHPTLHKQLRDLRDQICEAQNLPIYYVAGSAAVDEMAKYLPHTPEELKQITGFGEPKVEKYGAQFLHLITEYAKEKGLTSLIHEKNKPTSAVKPTTEKTDSKTGKTTTLTLELFNKGVSIEKIAAERNLSVSTIEGHLAQMVKSGEADIYKLLPKEKIATILDTINTAQTDQAAAMMQQLGEGYTYAELRYVINYHKFLKEKALKIG